MKRIAAPIVAALMGAAFALPAAAQQTVLQAARAAESAKLTDPRGGFWKAAKPVKVTMLPQIMATPRNPEPSVKELQVRAVHNGQWIAVLLEWKDATKNDRVGIDQFGDQVAVQLPVKFKKGDAMPSPTMGHRGARVDIWQWRAAFQRDLELEAPRKPGAEPQAVDQLREMYPHAMVDLYPDQVLSATDARPYTGALGLDNPVSHAKRSPVLDQMAEGFGTMTVDPEDQDADGWGVWENGTWRVAISHPMTGAAGESDISLAPGHESVIAFAVWDGAKREVGARKAWSSWIPLKLAR